MLTEVRKALGGNRETGGPNGIQDEEDIQLQRIPTGVRYSEGYVHGGRSTGTLVN
jgi:hypothetical protein